MPTVWRLNRKHEMFLNKFLYKFSNKNGKLNRKHEMFLNKNKRKNN